MVKNKLLANIASLGIVQIANYVLPLVSVPVISRIIGPEKFGVINYAAFFIAYFTLLIAYGFDFTAVRRLARNSDNIELRSRVFSEVFSCQLILFIISTGIFFFCLQFTAPLNKDKEVAVFTYLLCVAMLFTQNWLFQAMQELSKVALLNVLGKLFFTVWVLVAIKNPRDYVYQPLIASISQLLIAFVSFGWAYKRYGLRLRLIGLKESFKIIWEEKAIFLSSVVVSLYTSTNTVLLGIFRDNTEVGYYSAAQKLIEAARITTNMPLNQAFYPFVAAAFGKSREKGTEVLQKIFPVVFYFTLFVGICLFVCGPFFLPLYYGKEFLPSILPFEILSILPMLSALSNVLGTQTLLNIGKDREFLIVTIIGAVVGVTLNCTLTWKYGYIATAVNYVITEIIILMFLFFYTRKNNLSIIVLRNFNLRYILNFTFSRIKKTD